MRKFVPPAYATTLKPGPQNTGVHKPSVLMAYDYLMLTNNKVSADIVYKVLKAMHDNPKDMTAAFPGMRLFRPDAMAKKFPGVSYHAGAVKYYKEIGQWPPK